ncbi:site-specific integrase [Mycobacterium sp. SM1]|nr:site-specific integrase [Mycobacterium sp. SM1]MBS4730422.1 site-specific integrase [Mycobacterium sp. SM1]
MRRVVMPQTEFESWTVLGDDQLPVEPVERFLAYLASIEKSPNTIKAYAHDLKDWFTYLGGHGRDWRSATLEDVARFVAWLRLSPPARDGTVAVLPTVAHHCWAASVNRKLAALTSFCGFHARHGVELTGLLIGMQPTSGRGRSATAYKPFLHHVTKNEPRRRRAVTLTHPRPRPKVLTAKKAQRILDACEHLRIGCCSPCCSTPASASVSRWGCATRISTSRPGRLPSGRDPTTTAPGPRPACAGRSRPARS